MLLHHIVLAITAAFTSAQKLGDLPLSPNWQNVSESCVEALNTTVSDCPSFLGVVSVNTPRLKSDQLEQLCTQACKTSLADVRVTIEAGCDSHTDTMEWEGVVWPGES